MSKQKRMTAFEQAVVDSILAEYKDLPSEDELNENISFDFQHWSIKLIKKTRNPYWYYVNTTVKKVILIAIIFSMLTMTAMAVPSIREAIIDFFFHNHGERYGITFDPAEAATAPKQIEIAQFPTALPEGYMMVEHNVTPAMVHGIWVTNNGSVISYMQYRLHENATSDTWIGIDAEDVTRSSRVIGEYLVEFVWYDESYGLFWTDNAYVYSLELPNSITDEAMVEIFSSIQPIEQDAIQNGG